MQGRGCDSRADVKGLGTRQSRRRAADTSPEKTKPLQLLFFKKLKLL